jgi:UDP-glucose:(heptosyl)LPS alpha-1,3-glucosyltransferase
VLVLLLIGNDLKIKGLGTVLRALALLPDLPLSLIIAGSDSLHPFMELARQLHVADRCVWQSPVSDVLELYAAADLYVAPSLEDSFGLPVAEAMACGLPVITSVCTGVADRIRDGYDGFVLADPSDPGSLSRLIRTLAADPELRRRMGESAARTAAQWTWDRSAAAAWQLIEELVARKAVRPGLADHKRR